MIWALFLIPALAGGAAFFLSGDRLRRGVLIAVAVVHGALTALLWRQPTESVPPILNGWIAIDSASLLFLSVTSVLFLAAAVYAVHYLAQQTHAMHIVEAAAPSTPARDGSEATFTGCLLLFLATMTLVLISRHLGLLWVAVEATTLVSAPLICFHRNPRSLEATWKYLLICSVGIALALLGNFFLAVAAQRSQTPIHLTLDQLLPQAANLDPLWLKAAFLMLLVGYGTKMGLAPLHTWLPDAHSEAPSVISALLSGALLNCALLGILRVHGVLVAAGLGAFSRELLVVFGLFSLATAAVFIVGQADFKRMLAYSSVEHMGVLALGVGVGGCGGFGAMLHAVNHSLAKAMLFLVAGNLLAIYRTKSTRSIQGLLRMTPASGALWMAGFLAISGSPPFGLFLSEFTILKGAVDGGHPLIATAYVAALVAVFVGMATIILRMVYGEPPAAAGDGKKPGRTSVAQPVAESWWSIVPPVALGLGVLLLGLYVPPQLADLLNDAAAVLGAN